MADNSTPWNILMGYMGFPQPQSPSYDGVCQLPDGSIHPYTDAGGGYGNIYGGGSLNSFGQSGLGNAANSVAQPTLDKRGGLGGGGPSGKYTSPASKIVRDMTDGLRIPVLKNVSPTASFGGTLSRPFPGSARL